MRKKSPKLDFIMTWVVNILCWDSHPFNPSREALTVTSLAGDLNR